MSALHASPLALARQPTVRRFEDRGRAAELRGARLALLGVRDALLALTEGTAAEGRALLDLLIHEVRGAHLALDGTLSLAIVDVAPREERARLRACADALHDDLSHLLERELSAPRPSAIILFDAAERVHGLVERVREFEGVSEAALALEACLLEIERFRPEDGVEERIDELAELLLSIQFLPATIARARSPSRWPSRPRRSSGTTSTPRTAWRSSSWRWPMCCGATPSAPRRAGAGSDRWAIASRAPGPS